MLEEPDLVVLARIIDRGSFARAAAELGVPPSTLSRRITALEHRLGVRTLERTTRHLRATEIGEILAARGRRVRAELEQAERDVSDHRQAPRGLLRLAVPSPAGDFIGPVIADVLARYPELRLELAITDAPLEQLANGFDAALYGGALRGARSYGVLRLGRISPVLAASSSYLARAPAIRHPRDLADPAHTIIARVRRPSWLFSHPKTAREATVVPAAARVLVTAKSLGAELAAVGVGLALIPRTALASHPELRVVEPGGFRPVGGPFSLVTPSARTSAPKVRAFSDAMRAHIAAHPELFP